MSRYKLPKDDYYDLAAIGLCRAALSYDETKSKFSTYAEKCMQTDVFCNTKNQYASKRIPKHLLFEYNAEFNNDDDESKSYSMFIPSNDDVETESILRVSVEDYIKNSSLRDRKIISLLIKGYSHQTIALKVGCSRSLVSTIKMKLINYLREGV